ncbi:bifunctional phosphoribosyl-AMP cyclohydrolase/phosphoribosyl-ATP pyrophosphatase [Weissella confusa]|uniref:Histidine biosynthesis bifunctional protein HisIE n=2 Tax=Weissella confusa TaxID=1583 RepID=A0AAJ2YXK2_WEICO|nr:bifunctional phosphoribosyl-AMP cyclohydrolase/phosphoribosyl-ATP diphosphatase HisIE [Weissella confusa]MBJ7693895.1 bifunctional phosphoribosyl-AMP cyclohydrolase/phosphoribosyl-ATP diphosphatase HisIE [Weissella confusa]NBA11148.1 bifunctional phosphoribosyl-AMP cyclohydrolase/phosphoribosyl-ATP diphosphatase HisIE [Weissella confusa]QBZ05600.1 bifunctional phosphoribosyl-AMP cyclohydrolase/phosphoribosyl-ATP pyrophosphatase [Weissella confusa]
MLNLTPKFDAKTGLLPVVVQDYNTKRVLTLAYMNAESYQKTLETKETWFWSRSRHELWHKGATSGHTQQVIKMTLDCDVDALVVQVLPNGPACHTGAVSCFFNDLTEGKLMADQTFEELYELVLNRQKVPKPDSYTDYLFSKGRDKILKKLGEEATEVVIAAKENKQELQYEVADLLFHLMVLLVNEGVTIADIEQELGSRLGVSSVLKERVTVEKY